MIALLMNATIDLAMSDTVDSLDRVYSLEIRDLRLSGLKIIENSVCNLQGGSHRGSEKSGFEVVDEGHQYRKGTSLNLIN